MKTQVSTATAVDHSRNADFSYRVDSRKSAKEIFDFLVQVNNWWTGLYEETITGKSEKPGDEFEFLAGGGLHYTKQRLVELIPNKRIIWEVTGAKLSFVSKTDEWIGTRLRFDISDLGNTRRVTFTHEGLAPRFECYGSCSGAWTAYMEELASKLN
jgi:hypothetical protein